MWQMFKRSIIAGVELSCWLSVISAAMLLVLEADQVFAAVSPDGNETKLFAIMIVINFTLLTLFCVVNWLTTKQIYASYVKSWYYAWLAWALLYAAYIMRDYGNHALSPAMDFGFDKGILPGILSIANSCFFLLTALQLAHWFRERYRYVVILSVGVLAGAVLGLTVSIDHSGQTAMNLFRVPDAVLSILVGAALGLAFLKRISLRAIHRQNDLRITMLRWIVAGFFVLFIVHQAIIPLFQAREDLEQLFWVVSIVMKGGLFSLFFVVLLADRYWEQAKINEMVFDSLDEGWIAVDEDGVIVLANQTSAEFLGLSVARMLGRPINEVFFRSYFDSRKFFKRVREQGSVSNMKVLAKQHVEEDGVDNFRESQRTIFGKLIGDSEVGRTYALMRIDRGTQEKGGTHL